jgi:hypothetical protein
MRAWGGGAGQKHATHRASTRSGTRARSIDGTQRRWTWRAHASLLRVCALTRQLVACGRRLAVRCGAPPGRRTPRSVASARAAAAAGRRGRGAVRRRARATRRRASAGARCREPRPHARGRRRRRRPNRWVIDAPCPLFATHGGSISCPHPPGVGSCIACHQRTRWRCVQRCARGRSAELQLREGLSHVSGIGTELNRWSQVGTAWAGEALPAMRRELVAAAFARKQQANLELSQSILASP